MIIDTGSSIVAVPCKNYCQARGYHSCGKHINEWYNFDESTSGHIYNCKKDSGCKCLANDRCKFYQGYLEGSAYDGFMVEDQVYFGDDYHNGLDAFMFSFGCVSKETNMFYD